MKELYRGESPEERARITARLEELIRLTAPEPKRTVGQDIVQAAIKAAKVVGSVLYALWIGLLFVFVLWALGLARFYDAE